MPLQYIVDEVDPGSAHLVLFSWGVTLAGTRDISREFPPRRDTGRDALALDVAVEAFLVVDGLESPAGVLRISRRLVRQSLDERGLFVP